MAATYVKITRAQFEDWLFEICPVFERVEDTQGLYLCPLSPHVSVKVGSSIGRTSKVMERGAASCKMTLVSRHTERSLSNAPGSDDVSFRKCNRTKGWRDNWRDALKELFASFKSNRDHYNTLAERSWEQLAEEWIARIEGISNYAKFDILVDCREKLRNGAWLSAKQETAIWKFVNPRRKRKATKTTGTPAAPAKSLTNRDQTALLQALDRLETKARAAGHTWTVKFADGNVRNRVRSGKTPTPNQCKTLREKLSQYKIHVPATIAA